MFGRGYGYPFLLREPLPTSVANLIIIEKGWIGCNESATIHYREKAAPIFHEARRVKSAADKKWIRTAMRSTCEGVKSMTEYQSDTTEFDSTPPIHNSYQVDRGRGILKSQPGMFLSSVLRRLRDVCPASSSSDGDDY